MTYSSIVFIFYFLFVLMVFSFLSNRWKVLCLLVSSAIWLFSWKMHWMLIYLIISSLNYLFLIFMKNKIGKVRDNLFISLLFVNVLIFVALKSGGILGQKFQTPYGVSFFMFIQFGYLIDLWRMDSKFQIEKFSHYLLMPNFFPTLMGGPIVRGKEFFPQLNNLKSFSLDNLVNGLLIFAYGFCKFYFISKDLLVVNNYLIMLLADNNFFILILVGIVGTFQAYIEFSSYCDMGRGVAKCFGIDLMPNFRAFYYSKNPNDFWQRWNITLGTWIRDYISFPLMFRWGRKINQNFILIFSFVLVGLWHGVQWNWIMFGTFNGAIIVLYNLINKKFNIPFFGRAFAIIIFIGNGLLQRPNLIPSFEKMMGFKYLWNPSVGQWHLFASNVSMKLCISLLLMFVAEYFQEKFNNVDWFTKFNLIIKGIIVIVFLAWIFSGLNSHLFLEDVTLPPNYFRI